jgi:leucyl aminopeptidase
MAEVYSNIPEGYYRIEEDDLSEKDKFSLCLGWFLGQYNYNYYKKEEDTKKEKSLIWPVNVDKKRVNAFKDAIFWGRDLINTPAVDLGPEDLGKIVQQFSKSSGGKCDIVSGIKLEKDFPCIYAVGKSGEQKPCLIDFIWGNPSDPKITLVGKGVCFDSGGLDIKPTSAMLTMKRDMAGAAYVLSLAKLIIDLNLAYRLRVLIPAVENGIGPNAMRPMDILNTRKGISVEIGNTDAEGRLILADALFEASKESPDLLLDCATLTGAASVALGEDVPA